VGKHGKLPLGLDSSCELFSHLNEHVFFLPMICRNPLSQARGGKARKVHGVSRRSVLRIWFPTKWAFMFLAASLLLLVSGSQCELARAIELTSEQKIALLLL